MSEDSLEYLRGFMRAIPHQFAIGLELLEVDATHVVGCIPYSEKLVGNPLSGVLHGGIVTTLLDAVGGAAVLARAGRMVSMATLDLRIDYLRPAEVGNDLIADVECYKLTRNVAFARGFARHRDPDDPIASMSATYMLDTPTSRRSAEQS